MSKVNMTSEYLTSSHIWPLVLNESTHPSLTETEGEPIMPKTLVLHPLAVAGMKVTALGLSYLLKDSLATMKALENEHIVVEFDTEDDSSYENYPSFEAYLNADDSLVRYRVSDDKIAVHLAGSAPPNVVQGQSLAAHKVAQIATEADRLCYFRNNVASHVPHLLLQRLLHDTQIRENRVPGSTAVYEKNSRTKFLDNKYIFANVPEKY